MTFHYNMLTVCLCVWQELITIIKIKRHLQMIGLVFLVVSLIYFPNDNVSNEK